MHLVGFVIGKLFIVSVKHNNIIASYQLSLFSWLRVSAFFYHHQAILQKFNQIKCEIQFILISLQLHEDLLPI